MDETKIQMYGLKMVSYHSVRLEKTHWVIRHRLSFLYIVGRQPFTVLQVTVESLKIQKEIMYCIFEKRINSTNWELIRQLEFRHRQIEICI